MGKHDIRTEQCNSVQFGICLVQVRNFSRIRYLEKILEKYHIDL